MAEAHNRSAYDMLKVTDTIRALRTRHRDFYLELAEQAERADDHQRTAWLLVLSEERGNLRSAIDWSLDRNETEQAARLAAAVARTMGWLDANRDDLRRLEATVDASEDIAPRIRARLLVESSVIQRILGDTVTALAWGEEAERIALELGDEALRALAAATIGSIWCMTPDGWDRALAKCDEALEIARTIGDVRTEAYALHWSGRFREALERWKTLGDESWIAATQVSLAFDEARAGQVEQARRMLQATLAEPATPATAQTHLRALDYLGMAEAEAGDDEAASRAWAEAIERSRSLPPSALSATPYLRLAYATLRKGDVEGARALAREGTRRAAACGAQWELAYGLEECAAVSADDEPAKAARLIGAAEALREAIGRGLWDDADRQRHGRLVDRVRQAVGREAYEHEWSTGRRAKLDDAVTEAIG